MNLLLSYKPNDYRIDLIKNTKPPARKIYNLSRNQAAVIKEYIDEIAVKGFIKPSNLLYAAPVLVMKKSKKELKIYIDYRILIYLRLRIVTLFY